MKRDHPEVVRAFAHEALPRPPHEVVEVLGPMVTEGRLSRMKEIIDRRARSLIPVLEDLHDPHNGAAILRSADAFGCHEVHVIEQKHEFRISHRVTRGTHRWLELHSHPNSLECLQALKGRGYKIFVAAMDGDLTPADIAAEEKAAVVFGNEHLGLSEAALELADGRYAIEMEGFVESLNVSVASAITLYVASRGRHGCLSESDKQAILARYLFNQVAGAAEILSTTP